MRSVFSGPRAVILTFALSLMGCIAPQVSTTQSTKNPFRSEQIEEKDATDIDNPVFIALVSIGAELKFKLKPNSTPQTLQSLERYISERLEEMNIHYDRCDVTISET